MNKKKHYITSPYFSPRRLCILLGLLIFFAAPSVVAQNSKGDKPAKQSPVLRFPKVKRHSKGGDRAYTGDISGRRKIRTKNSSSSNHAVYSNNNPTSKRLGTKSSSNHYVPARFKVRVRSVSAQSARHKVYPQKGRYVHNPSPKPERKTKTYSRPASGNAIIRSDPNNRHQRAWIGNLKGGAIGAPSISRPYVTRGRKDVYWGKFSKGGKAVTRDLTGRELRQLNFRSASPGIGRSDTGRNSQRKRSVGGLGSLRGGYSSISGGGKAWTTDISGHALRKRLATQGRGGHGLFSGFRSASGRGNNSLPSHRRKFGAGLFGSRGGLRKQFGGAGIGNYRGDVPKEDLFPSFSGSGLGYSGGIKSGGAFHGGGSVSGKFFNNGGRSLRGGAGSISGRVFNNGGRSLRGGYGSISGGSFNNGGRPLGRGNASASGQFFNNGGRPLRGGGGSISGRLFNNNGQSLGARPPGGALGMGSFQGNLLRDDVSTKGLNGGVGYSGFIKRGRPFKGGGSISGKFFNNNGRALSVRPPAQGSWALGSFRGHIYKEDLEPARDPGLSGFTGNKKQKRPLKGGGSISGKFLGNDGKAVQVRPPGRASWAIGNFRGSIKTKKPEKGGGSVSGIVWNNDEKPITAKEPISGSGLTYSGKILLPRFKRSYVKNPHSIDEALKKRKPGQMTFMIGGLTGRVKQHGSEKNPSSNPNSLKTWSPGVAYARLKDYQGNVKMRKLTGRLHPDSKFAHGNLDNVKNERTLKTNIKLLWAKLFKKSGGQPDIVKQKELHPRYDKKEKDLWKPLYD